MLPQVTEVLKCFFISRCSQSFVVPHMPQMHVSPVSRPVLELIESEEGHDLATMSCFKDWGYELLDEGIHLDEFRPEMMNEVDKETFDMRPIIILVCHDHY
jgi:hypothetical protein